MDKTDSDIRLEVSRLLAEGYRIWGHSPLPELPESERRAAADVAFETYRGGHSAHFAAACQCFYLFRKLHAAAGEYPVWATLLGDYFFSQFSKNLVPIDSTRLNDEFSQFLEKDAGSAQSTDDYFRFVRGLDVVINE